MIKQVIAAATIFTAVFTAPAPQSPLIPQKIVTYDLIVPPTLSNAKDCQSAWGYAMSIWEMNAPKYVKFRPVRPGETPDYQVFFAPQVHMNPNVVGWIMPEVENKRAKGTIMVKSDMSLDKGANLNFDCMVHVSLHEIGHMLGLKDDYKPGNLAIGKLMGAIDLNRPVHQPSPDDVSRVERANERGEREKCILGSR